MTVLLCLACLLIGATLGLLIAGLCAAASHEDDLHQRP